MAEPRKPRVIRTRSAQETGAGSADAPAQDARPVPPAGGVQPPAAPTAGAVRSTSSKVSVEPVPAGDRGSAARPDRAKAGPDKARTARATGAGLGAKARARKLGQAAAGPADSASTPAPADRAGAGAAQPRTGKAVTGKTGAAQPGTAKPGSTKPGAAGSDRAGAVGPGPAAGTAHVNPAGDDDGPDAQVLAFPLPAHKRRRRAVIYGTAGVVVVLALIMSFALFSPVLAVKTVVFEGQKLVDPKVLDHAVAPIYGTPLPQVTADEVQALLGPVVQVKSSSIEAKPPSTLLVHIVERVPVALLKNEDSYLMVDQDGVELGSTADPASVPLPLIDGGKAVIGQDTFKAMTAVLANLPQTILSQLANATAASPDAVELKLIDGRSVIWGDASDMELKAVVLEALLTAPAPEPVAGAPEPAPVNVFDVSAPRHPVTR